MMKALLTSSCIASLLLLVILPVKAVATENNNQIFQLETAPVLGNMVTSSSAKLCDVAKRHC